jgi:hypothetical protein
MNKSTAQITTLTLFMVMCVAASGRTQGLDFSGYVAGEGRFFLQEAALDGQQDGPQGSLVAQPELRLKIADRPHQFKLTPFFRLDGMDEERTHFDLREAYWRYSADSWELLVGANKVFWGVTESRHLVDIINQTDILEDVDQEDKLGQPMLMVGHQRDWGELQFYLMPYFRERRYPGSDGRLRTPLPVEDKGVYESGAEEYHPDVALRYAHYIGDWDLGAYYFNGTGREPRLLLNDRGDRLIPHYDLIQQVGVDLQYTREAWLWKFEGIVREGQGDLFAAAVGGFEYTFYQLAESAADLGLLMEYNWDGRQEDEAPATTFDNDLFMGLRLALNDPQDTSALLGAAVDLENGSTLASFEAARRLGRSFVLEVQARFFIQIDDQDPAKSIEDDDFVTVSLQYHF